MAVGDPVTVVVVNHDGEAYLPACLRAVLAENPREVIVVDSGSTDRSLALLSGEFPSVRVHALGANLGPAAARNEGIRMALSADVLCVDNDVVLTSGCIARMQAAMDLDERVAVVQARSLCADQPTTIHYDGADIHYVGLLALRNWYAPLAQAEARGSVEVGAAISLCVLIDRDAVLSVGGFFEEMSILFEDTELCLRLRLAGHKVCVAEDAHCLHRGGTPGLSLRGRNDAYAGRRTFLHARNRWLLLLSCYRVRTLIAIAPALLAYGLVHFAFVAASGHFFHWLRGKFSFLRLLPAAWRRRRQLWPARRLRDAEVLTASPLTYNPGLAERGLRGSVRRQLDRFLAAWWRLVQSRAG